MRHKVLTRQETKSRKIVASFATELRQLVLKYRSDFHSVLTVQRDEFATFNQVDKVLYELLTLRSGYSHRDLDEAIHRLWWDHSVAECS